MAARLAANPGLAREVLVDFMWLGGKAVASGVLAALILALLALVLAASAEAARTETPVLQEVTPAWADGTPVPTFPARGPDLSACESLHITASARAFAGTAIVSGKCVSPPRSAALTPMSDPTGVGALWAKPE